MTRSAGRAVVAVAACALALAAVIPSEVNRSPVPPITAPLPTFLLPPESPPGPQPPATSATSPASPLPLPLLPAVVLLIAPPPPIP